MLSNNAGNHWLAGLSRSSPSFTFLGRHETNQLFLRPCPNTREVRLPTRQKVKTHNYTDEFVYLLSQRGQSTTFLHSMITCSLEKSKRKKE